MFLELKGYKRNHKNFLLKNSFPKNNKEKNFTSNPNARARQYTRFREYILTIYASSSLLIPSADHLCAILSLTIVRVRRENFSFSKICIGESHEYHLIDKRHLSTIFLRSQVFDQGPPPRDVVYASSY